MFTIANTIMLVNINFRRDNVNKANEDIRSRAASARVHLWQIANALGMRDSEFSRQLRFELAENEKTKIFEVINALKAERGA